MRSLDEQNGIRSPRCTPPRAGIALPIAPVSTSSLESMRIHQLAVLAEAGSGKTSPSPDRFTTFQTGTASNGDVQSADRAAGLLRAEETAIDPRP